MVSVSDKQKSDDANDDEDKQDGANTQPSSDNGDQPSGKDDAGKDEEEKPSSHLPLIISGIALVVVLIVALIYWFLTKNEITTDDAYTDGRAVSIAANLSGYVTQLYVDDNSFVHAGQLLLVIDPRDSQAAVAQAEANLALAQAQLASAEVDLAEIQVRAPAQLEQAEGQLEQAQAQEYQAARDYERQHNVDRRATAAADVDQATQQLKSAAAAVKQARAQVASAALVPQMIQSAAETVSQRQAQVQQAQASLAQAQVKQSYTQITAPQDGSITMRNAELGTYVQTGQQLFYIVTPQIWVTANYKETQLDRIRPGDKVIMTVDAYPRLKLHGHVQSIQQGSGARFTAFPAENATGNFVKIVRRVPVKIVIDSGLPPDMIGLPLGISVTPTVYVK